MRSKRLSILLASLLAAAGVAAAACADGLPGLGIDAGGTGLVSPSGEARYVTVPAGIDTVVARVSVKGGRVLASSLLPGTLTIPAVAYDGSASGLSGDGRTLVLIEPRQSFPRARTRFELVAARTLAARELITLRGDFSFDAVSPDGSVVYLIQYLSPTDPTRYLVRAYDVRSGRLLGAPVIDPREPGEKMRGTPRSRVAGIGGRWAYTLYDVAGGTPFLHALDTSTRTARCIDLDALAGEDASLLRLRLDDRGRTVSVVRRGRAVLAVDVRSFAVSGGQT
jgi:hypothetical protein